MGEEGNLINPVPCYKNKKVLAATAGALTLGALGAGAKYLYDRKADSKKKDSKSWLAMIPDFGYGTAGRVATVVGGLLGTIGAILGAKKLWNYCSGTSDDENKNNNKHKKSLTKSFNAAADSDNATNGHTPSDKPGNSPNGKPNSSNNSTDVSKAKIGDLSQGDLGGGGQKLTPPPTDDGDKLNSSNLDKKGQSTGLNHDPAWKSNVANSGIPGSAAGGPRRDQTESILRPSKGDGAPTDSPIDTGNLGVDNPTILQISGRPGKRGRDGKNTRRKCSQGGASGFNGSHNNPLPNRQRIRPTNHENSVNQNNESGSSNPLNRLNRGKRHSSYALLPHHNNTGGGTNNDGLVTNYVGKKKRSRGGHNDGGKKKKSRWVQEQPISVRCSNKNPRASSTP